MKTRAFPYGTPSYDVKIEYTGEFPWPWTIWVEPPGYPDTGVHADNSLAFTEKGAEQSARRIIARMERARKKNATRKFKVPAGA